MNIASYPSSDVTGGPTNQLISAEGKDAKEISG